MTGRAMSQNTLFFREWFFTLLVLLFGALLVVVSSPYVVISSEGVEKSKESHDQRKIQVLLSGDVKKPGLYEVEAGMSVKKLLQKAGLEKTADAKVLYGKKMLIRSCEIHVPSKKDAQKKTRNGSAPN